MENIGQCGGTSTPRPPLHPTLTPTPSSNHATHLTACSTHWHQPLVPTATEASSRRHCRQQRWPPSCPHLNPALQWQTIPLSPLEGPTQSLQGSQPTNRGDQHLLVLSPPGCPAAHSRVKAPSFPACLPHAPDLINETALELASAWHCLSGGLLVVTTHQQSVMSRCRIAPLLQTGSQRPVISQQGPGLLWCWPRLVRSSPPLTKEGLCNIPNTQAEHLQASRSHGSSQEICCVGATAHQP